MSEKPSSRLTNEKQHVYERINPSTEQRSIQIGSNQIASATLDEHGRPTIEVYEQKR
jgi:hypothetical protein